MSAPIYFICKAENIPNVEDVNASLAALGYGTRLDEADLWPGREFGVLSAIRDGEASTLHLSRESVRSKAEYIARILGRVAPQQNLEFEIDRLETEFGDQLIEACYSWPNGLACAEVHHAVVAASNARLWDPLDRVSADDILSEHETAQRLTKAVQYQVEQATILKNQRVS